MASLYPLFCLSPNPSPSAVLQLLPWGHGSCAHSWPCICGVLGVAGCCPGFSWAWHRAAGCCGGGNWGTGVLAVIPRPGDRGWRHTPALGCRCPCGRVPRDGAVRHPTAPSPPSFPSASLLLLPIPPCILPPPPSLPASLRPSIPPSIPPCIPPPLRASLSPPLSPSRRLMPGALPHAPGQQALPCSFAGTTGCCFPAPPASLCIPRDLQAFELCRAEGNFHLLFPVHELGLWKSP